MSFLRRPWEFTKRIYRAARDERASPREIGWAVGIGVFVSCGPTFGFHGLVALAAATLFRKNRLFCWLGARFGNVVTLPFIVFAEVNVAHLLRTGHFATIERSTVLNQAPSLLLDWIIGLVPVGGVLGLLGGLAAFAFAKRRARRKLASASGLSHNVVHERNEPGEQPEQRTPTSSEP